jgi:hypothetical protein
MSDLRKAAQQALEALENPWSAGAEGVADAITTLRAALAQPEQDLQLVANFLKEYGLEVLEVIAALKTQPEQEPVAWRYLEDPFGANEYLITDDPETAKGPGWTPLYTHPPQRKPLTEEEIEYLAPVSFTWRDMVTFARMVEGEHGIGGEE